MRVASVTTGVVMICTPDGWCCESPGLMKSMLGLCSNFSDDYRGAQWLLHNQV